MAEDALLAPSGGDGARSVVHGNLPQGAKALGQSSGRDIGAEQADSVDPTQDVFGEHGTGPDQQGHRRQPSRSLQYPHREVRGALLAVLIAFARLPLQAVALPPQISRHRGEHVLDFVGEGDALFLGFGVVHRGDIRIELRVRTENRGNKLAIRLFAYPGLRIVEQLKMNY